MCSSHRNGSAPDAAAGVLHFVPPIHLFDIVHASAGEPALEPQWHIPAQEKKKEHQMSSRAAAGEPASVSAPVAHTCAGAAGQQGSMQVGYLGRVAGGNMQHWSEGPCLFLQAPCCPSALRAAEQPASKAHQRSSRPKRLFSCFTLPLSR